MPQLQFNHPMPETPDNAASNRRIARNTLMLYIRMFFMMGIALYTSRVILQALGVVDYGIYNVVGGLVSMLGILNGSMSAATQRFITFALGKGDSQELNRVFSVSLQIHAAIAVLTLILIETAGLWFLYNKMQIGADRMDAAFWVLQLSALAAVFSIMAVPYNADIIAHEKMSAFASISIIEAILKLAITYLLLAVPFDKLVTYAALLVCVQLTVQACYMLYCHRHFAESHYRRCHAPALSREMTAYAGWNLFGGLSSISTNQGLSMLLNVFFGPVVNAARGIASQVQAAIQVFITNFQVAVNPQITKTYAQGDFDSLHLLMVRSSRFSYYLMLLLSLPVFFEAPAILRLWLGEVPEHTVMFLRLIICISLIYTIINPILAANGATGDVRMYFLVCGCLMISILPLSYLVLKLGCPAYSVFIVHFCVEAVTQLARLLLVRKKLRLSLRRYVADVYARLLLVTIPSILPPMLVCSAMPAGIGRLLAVGAASACAVCCFSWSLGLSRHERSYISLAARRVFQRFLPA